MFLRNVAGLSLIGLAGLFGVPWLAGVLNALCLGLDAAYVGQGVTVAGFCRVHVGEIPPGCSAGRGGGRGGAGGPGVAAAEGRDETAGGARRGAGRRRDWFDRFDARGFLKTLRRAFRARDHHAGDPPFIQPYSYRFSYGFAYYCRAVGAASASALLI